jgi:hypothetical protein
MSSELSNRIEEFVSSLEVRLARLKRSFKGYDPSAARGLFSEAAALLEEAGRRLAELEKEARAPSREGPDFSEETLAELLGKETGQILASARQAARELLEEARARAAELAARAERVLEEREDEARARASRVTEEAERAAKELVESAKEEADRIRQAAHRARERMLAELYGRRQHLAAQIEQLLAARDELVSLIRDVGSFARELERSLAEAEQRAREAGHAARGRVAPTQGPPAPGFLEEFAELEREEGARANRGAGDGGAGRPLGPPLGPQEGLEGTDQEGFEGIRIIGAIRVADAAEGVAAAEIGQGQRREEGEGVVEVAAAEGGEGTSEAPSSTDTIGQIFSKLRRESKEPEHQASQDERVHGRKRKPAKRADDGAPSTRETKESTRSAGRGGPAHGEGGGLGRESAVVPSKVSSEALPERVAEEGGPAATGDAEPAPEWHAPSRAASPAAEDGGTGEDQETHKTLASIASQLARKTKIALSDLQNDIVARIKAEVPSSAKDAQGLVYRLAEDMERQGRLAALTLSFLSQAHRLGGGRPDSKLVESISSRFTNGVMADVEEIVMPEGASPDELAEVVSAHFREVKGTALEGLAMDAVMEAYNGGVLEGCQFGDKLTWVLGPERCPDCEDNSLAVGVVGREPFPTGHYTPPAHPGCRCLLAPAPS